ncbi:hypothetical protein [Allobaculum sp. Allo2]|nr:hypothetical protein [Allobaculum sp. Allo2]
MHQCQGCHQLFPLEYSLVWRDPRSSLSLICTDRNPEGFEGNVVITRSSRQFLEAFSILDLQLPLKETLALKRRLEKEYGTRLRIVDYDAQKSILWLDKDGDLIGIRSILPKSS